MVGISAEPGQAQTVWPWAQAPLFRGLGAEERGSIAARLTMQAFQAGEALIRQGARAGALFIIHSGIVQIEIERGDAAGPPGPVGPAERAKPLRRLVSGDCFGEMSLITGTPPSATARALTAGEVWVLGQQDFLQLAMSQPQLSYNINRILSERLSHTSRHQLVEAVPQVVVIAADGQEPWLSLARQVARLTRRATLFVDLGVRGGAAIPFTLGDLLSGRLRPGAATPASGLATRLLSEGLTIVRGMGAGADDAPASDLPAALGHLGETYQYALVVLPPGHPLLTIGLLTYATRVLVGERIGALTRLRATLADLPRPAAENISQEIGVVLTDVAEPIAPTATVREALSEELGVPVHGLIPAVGRRQLAAVAAVARWLVGQRIGWVLGAGGARGFAHVGAVRALRRARLPLDCAAGSSIGAIISAGVALDLSDAAIDAALRGGAGRAFRPTVPLHAILSNAALARWFRRADVFGMRQIEDTIYPFAVSATDLTQGQEIVIRRGPIWRAVLASAAIPGIYPPSLIGKQWLVDGGVVNPVPVSVARLLGADIVVAVDLSLPLVPRQELDLAGNTPPPRQPRLIETMLRARDILMSEIRAHTVGEPAILIKPQVTGVAIRDFGDGARFIAAGEEAAEAILPRLRELLPWLDEPTEAEPTCR